MERRQQIRSTLYAMVVVDVAVVAAVVLLSRVFPIALLTVVFVPALLTFNFLFLRKRLKTTGQVSPEDRAAGRSHKFSVYACSAVFFLGTIYGLLMISQGQLPGTTLPVLLVPLSLAVYCLRTGLRAGSRRLN
jgi:hypothetical protein